MSLVRSGAVRSTLLLALLGTLLSATAHAVDPDPYPVPPGLEPGDHYHIIFTTSTNRDAWSSDAADYDAHVLAAANSAGIGDELGIGWTALVSVGDETAPQHHARDRVSLGANVPVYNTRLELVATGFADLWDGSLQNPLNSDEHGRMVGGDSWTGSNADGTADEVDYLGSSSPVAWCGQASAIDERWIRNVTPGKGAGLHVIAMSEELTVPEPSEVEMVTISGADGSYQQSFDEALGMDANLNRSLPLGWSVTAGDFLACSTTQNFPASFFAATGVFNAGEPGSTDRTVAILGSSSEDTTIAFEAEVKDSAGRYANLSFDVEAWDAISTAMTPGEASVRVFVDVGTAGDYTQVADLGTVTTGTSLLPPEGDYLSGNVEDHRTSVESVSVEIDAPVGSQVRVRWVAEASPTIAGWIFGIDNFAISCSDRAPAPTFRRGDGNSDGAVNISDVLFTLNFLFSDFGEPMCDDALDANNDGLVNISDALATIGFLFLSDVTELPPPGVSACGVDPSEDDDVLGCAASPTCE